MSGVVSATDYFTGVALSRAGLGSLLGAGLGRDEIEPGEAPVERPSRSLADELAIRDARVAALHDVPARRDGVEELVAGMPGMTTWTSSARPAPEAPASVAGTDYPWRVEYSDEPARHRIKLSYEGVRAIEEHVSAVAPERIETGGFCWVHPLGITNTEAYIDFVTGPPARAVLSRHRVELRPEEEHRAEFPSWIDSETTRRIGEFHTHPSGNPEPSGLDVNAWASYCWRHDRSCFHEYAALIVTPARDGGDTGLGVELHGYWTRRRSPGSYVVTRARVEQPRY